MLFRMCATVLLRGRRMRMSRWLGAERERTCASLRAFPVTLTCHSNYESTLHRNEDPRSKWTVTLFIAVIMAAAAMSESLRLRPAFSLLGSFWWLHTRTVPSDCMMIVHGMDAGQQLRPALDDASHDVPTLKRPALVQLDSSTCPKAT